MSHCRVPMVPRAVTSAPCSWATYATAIVSLCTSIPIKSVLDWDMVDLRVESCCCGSMRLWFRVSSPAFHWGATYRHRKSLCLGLSPQIQGKGKSTLNLDHDGIWQRAESALKPHSREGTKTLYI